MIEAIKEYGSFMWEVIIGYIFKEEFSRFNERCKQRDWNGLIKLLVYPLLFLFCSFMSLVILFIFTPLVLIVICGLPLEGIFKRIGKGIVCMDKKLRFKNGV